MSGPGRSLRFRLAISAQNYLAWYRGQAREIQVRALDGTSLRFPAGALRRFLTRDGVHGLFEIRFDLSNKLLSLEKLEEA